LQRTLKQGCLAGEENRDFNVAITFGTIADWIKAKHWACFVHSGLCFFFSWSAYVFSIWGCST